MIRVLQGNMNGTIDADNLLPQIAGERGVDIVLISEQYRNRSSSAWLSDRGNRSAIWLPKHGNPRMDECGSEDGFVWMTSGNVTYVSCYFSPNTTINEYRSLINNLEDSIRDQMKSSVIVAGDFNARAVEWGMPETNSRGRRVLEMAARLGLIVLNSGSVTTYRRPGYGESIPDITLASEDLKNLS